MEAKQCNDSITNSQATEKEVNLHQMSRMTLKRFSEKHWHSQRKKVWELDMMRDRRVLKAANQFCLPLDWIKMQCHQRMYRVSSPQNALYAANPTLVERPPIKKVKSKAWSFLVDKRSNYRRERDSMKKLIQLLKSWRISNQLPKALLSHAT
jgi:hypothetical protein